MADSVQFPIGYVSMMTGVSAHSLRAWERRYRAVTPTRTASGHRLYSQEDIDRIALLKQAIDAGHHISHVAGLDRAALKTLSTDVKASFPSPSIKKGEGAQPNVSRDVIPSCLQAIEALDGAALHRILWQASLRLSRQALLDTLIIPLMRQVGQKWSEGALRIMHEHLASNVVHAHLCHMLDYSAPATAELPRILIAAPAGQWCYLGALAVAVISQDHGWEPVFLGPNLPSEDIAAASATLTPQLIALSVTCRVNDAFMQNELSHLSDLLENGCPLIFGGQASESYRRDLETIGGHVCATPEDLVQMLH
jgi:DNA-binding transcriptional MerR regulator